jgi:hypothetical protein
MLWFLRKTFGILALAWIALWLIFVVSSFVNPKLAESSLPIVFLSGYAGVPACLLWAVLKIIDLVKKRRAEAAAGQYPLPAGATRQAGPILGLTLSQRAASPYPQRLAVGDVQLVPQPPPGTMAVPVRTLEQIPARPTAAPAPSVPPAAESAPLAGREPAAQRPPMVYTYEAPGQPMCPECGEKPTIFRCLSHQHEFCLACVAKHDEPGECVYVPAFRAPKTRHDS